MTNKYKHVSEKNRWVDVGDLVRCTWSDSLGVVVALKDRPPVPGHWVDFLSQRTGTVILMDSRELEVMMVLRSDK